MAARLMPSTLMKKFLKGVKPNSCLSPILSGNYVDSFLENNQSNPRLEESTQSLNNKFVLNNSVKGLDNENNLNSEVEIFKCLAIQKGFSHTVQTYYVTILKQGLDGNVEEMDRTCQDLVKDGCLGVEEVIVTLVNAFVRHGRTREALRVLPHVNLVGLKPSIETFNVVLAVFVEENRDIEEVLFVYKEMVKASIVPNVDTLNFLLAALFHAEQIKTAMNQFRRMSKKGCVPNSKTFEVLLNGLITRNLVDEAVLALGILYKIGCELDLSFYTCAVSLFCRVDRIDVGSWLFRMMKASNIIPDTLIYSTLIQSLCKNLLLDEALFLLEEMAESGLRPKDDVYVGIIKVFFELGKTGEAIKFVKDRCFLFTSPHNALLEGCCNVENILIANRVLGRMSKMSIDDCKSWNIVIGWLCNNARIGKAFEFLGKMIVLSFVPNKDTYAALIIGNCKSRRYEAALQLMNEVHARCWVLHAVCYSELIESLCQAKRTLEAAEVFCYMSKNKYPLHPSLFDTLIKGICDLGHIDEALVLLQLACYAGTSCKTMTYASIVYELSKSNKAEIALLVLSQMLVLGYSLNLETYCIFIHSFCAMNRVKDSITLFNRMVNEGLLPDSERLYDLLLCIADHSQLHMILTTIDKLIEHTDLVNTATYNLLINGLWKEDRKYEACKLLDSMLEKGWVPDAMTHGLLIGSLVNESSVIEDNVSSILVEGLGNT
ncbi:pentatricopeptide repeat-containing protein At1g64583, mitochondrial-like [Cucurbita maxima]|uniref:Pentatricopeptide repeat-containing protein At1g64583, mitochondrial-like n=1 Tax=Cucurbita maxima TaxID=3661 RepID=A0A6J1L2T0_CUCMA|nr:pentatricopeptide repeat-containing protein At1g64583, mitochondrial-like [Cucurbita maxima]XP_023005664.1 pentatricopeptide repeat-containing protein At1g64583, mitochondrial-like [Cucurbita maxima]XP_023005665.1 pentatricopeptide repeat-containing protein At1g64583, mitochondrial-like [Cucurbita maxima]XP_023005666.1 pentatricopeptide repeat-containing protein At1g64583, mitochondrial-like [Cucurbita maxima]